MRRFTLPLLSFALILMLFGCAQAGIPSSCTNVSVDTLSNCVYVTSVLEQNPYECYSLQNATQREKCLRDASDSAAQKLLAQMTPEERAKVFAAISGAIDASGVNVQIPLPPSNVQVNTTPSPTIINPPAGASEADSRAYEQAISANDIVPCTTITDASTRASCITQVAFRVKNPAICSQFTLKTDIDLCNLYAKGGA